jgi:transcriptional regulator with XRE-family HTH domain
MSQSQIAEALGVPDRSTISGYERGEREPPLPTLLKYARVAGLAVEYFIDDEIAVRVMVTK